MTFSSNCGHSSAEKPRPKEAPPTTVAMSSQEASVYLAAVKWSDEGHYLRDFVQRLGLPRAAKIVKGRFEGLGVPGLPAPHLSQSVLLASAGPRTKVLAQCVKFKDAGRKVPVGQKLTIPEGYDGWFEILSEEGRAVRGIESVAELAWKNPKSCLVRDSIKVHLPKVEDSGVVGDKTRSVSPGEVLTVGELVTGSPRGSRGSGKFLHCTTSFGDAVFLPMDLKGKFSAIAGEENISGVHSIRTLMSKRFPLTVRLVHGKLPSGVKVGSQFVHEMRLYSLIEEEYLVAMPLSKEGGVVALPLNATLKVLPPKNADVLAKMPEHSTLVNRCHSMMTEVFSSIQTYNPSTALEVKTPRYTKDPVMTRQKSLDRSVFLIKRSASDPQGTTGSGRIHLERGMSTPNDNSLTMNGEDCSDSDDLLYDEIDQIYDYVRGLAPLPEHLRNEFSVTEEQKSQLLPEINISGKSSERKPPEPPPIETIPIRKSSTGTIKHIQAPQKITVNIVNRTPSFKTKEIIVPRRNPKFQKTIDDHIYEKISNNKRDLKSVQILDSRTPHRSNSASKVFQNGLIQNNQCDNNNNNSKLPYNKRPLQNGHSRFLKNKNSSRIKDLSSSNRNKQDKGSFWVNSGVKTIATSPLFHIRYKSLTDLLMDTGKKSPTPESSNSSGKRMDGSGGSSFTVSSREDNDPPEDFSDDLALRRKTKGLSRPKSLSNLVGNVPPKRKTAEVHNNYFDLIKPPEIGCPKYFSMPDSSRYTKNHYGSNHHSKKLGTLYL